MKTSVAKTAIFHQIRAIAATLVGLLLGGYIYQTGIPDANSLYLIVGFILLNLILWSHAVGFKLQTAMSLMLANFTISIIYGISNATNYHSLSMLSYVTLALSVSVLWINLGLPKLQNRVSAHTVSRRIVCGGTQTALLGLGTIAAYMSFMFGHLFVSGYTPTDVYHLFRFTSEISFASVIFITSCLTSLFLLLTAVKAVAEQCNNW